MSLFFSSGNDAKLYFEKLRKRYNKKKNDVKKAKTSGSSTKDEEKAENALDVYKFLFWLDNFVYIRESRTNIPVARAESSDDEAVNDLDSQSDDEDESDVVDNDLVNTEVLSISHTSASNSVSTSSSLQKKKKSKEPEKRKVDEGFVQSTKKKLPK